MTKKILVIKSCKQCINYERNMYHGACCWHKSVTEPNSEGSIPKKIICKTSSEYQNPPIPKWCPLDDFQE